MSLPVFPVVILSSHTKQISRVARKKTKTQKVRLCFFTKSVRFGSTELSFGRICAESRDLEFGYGFRACSFKNKGKKSYFHIFGGQKTNKSLVPRALNDTKKIRKAGADIFANFGAKAKVAVALPPPPGRPK